MLTKLRNYWKQREIINKLKKDNKGSSFVLVMVSVALIMILVAILFVMIIMQYRMVSLSRQTKDNFYYLEEVLGEIRAGVGNESVNQLKTAYDETVSMVVHYDTNQQKYMSVGSDAANNIMRNKFNNYIAKVYCSEATTGLNDGSITKDQLKSLLMSYVKDINGTETSSGVKLDLSGVTCKAVRSGDPAATLGYRIYDVKVSRVDRRGNEQSIQTDISIYPPETALNFLASADDIENIFTYALVADYGVTVSGGDTTDVRVVGNVYAAADYRNNGIYGGTVETANETYTITGSQPGNVVGNVANLSDESLYSGIFVTGLKTSLNMQSDIIAVNGSIAAKDGAEISGNRKAESSSVDSGTVRAASLVWANNIVTLGSEGNDIDLCGTFNIADDLEVNASKSKVTLAGDYYGYNYAAEEEFNASSTAYQITTTNNDKSHKNSSAIIVNGAKSSLDLSAISTMLVNGRAYIDISSQKSHQTDTITNDVKTAESVAAKGTQLVYRVIDSRMINENLLTLSTEGTNVVGDGYDKVTLSANYPYSNVIRFLVHQFFEDGGNTIYTSEDSKGEKGTYDVDWAGVSKDDVLKDIVANGKNSDFYKDIMAVYFPTTQHIVATKNSAGNYTYKYENNNMVEITSCYNETYKIWKNDDEIPIAGNKTVHQYGFITIGKDYDEVAVVETKTGASESTHYFYQFYDDTAKQNFVKDYVAYSAKEDGVTDINSDELFDSAQIVMPDKDFNTVYTRGLYTLKEEDESKYTLKDCLKSNAFSEFELKQQYTQRLNLSRVYKCNFPRMNSTIGDDMIKEAENMYTNGTRNTTGKFKYDTKEDNISPLTNPSSINIDWNEVQNRTYAGEALKGYDSAKVWVTSGDVEINGSRDGKKINGIVLCMGNVSITNVEEFRGSIICAGKVSIEGQTNIYADEQLCNNMIVNDTNNMIRTCLGMGSYDSSLDSAADEGRPISSITYTDLVGYENWIKNGE